MVGIWLNPSIRLSNNSFGGVTVGISTLLPPFLGSFCFHVSRCSGQMNQVEVRAHPVKRLGVSKKEIAVRLKAVVEVLDYAALRSQIKIDKNVATKNEVDIFYKGHAQIVGEINPAKVDTAANHWLELKLAAHREEVFLAV